MKESRIIIIMSAILLLITSTFYGLTLLLWHNEALQSIMSNISCGAIVSLITAICQFYVAKQRIINNIYGSFLDVYNTYYLVINKPFFGHYSTYMIFKKYSEVSIAIKNSLSEYRGFFKTKDKTYYKINPPIKVEHFTEKEILKSNFKWFNKEQFKITIEPLIIELEKILQNIDSKRFEEDKKENEKMFNIVWENKKNKKRA